MKHNLFVHVQLEELHYVDAVLAIPAAAAAKLAVAGFIEFHPKADPPYVSTSAGDPQLPGSYTDDMLYKIPGAFILRNPRKRDKFGFLES